MQESGSADSWKNYLVYQQNGGTAKVRTPYTLLANKAAVTDRLDQWIGQDPSHIYYDVALTTTNGVIETTTATVVVSIQAPSTTAIDGSYKEAVLLAPNVVAELTDAAQ